MMMMTTTTTTILTGSVLKQGSQMMPCIALVWLISVRMRLWKLLWSWFRQDAPGLLWFGLFRFVWGCGSWSDPGSEKMPLDCSGSVDFGSDEAVEAGLILVQRRCSCIALVRLILVRMRLWKLVWSWFREDAPGLLWFGLFRFVWGCGSWSDPGSEKMPLDCSGSVDFGSDEAVEAGLILVQRRCPWIALVRLILVQRRMRMLVWSWNMVPGWY